MGRQFAPVLSRPFSEATDRRLLIVYEARKITEAQVFPFAYYARALADAYGAELRFIENARIVDGVPAGLRSATSVAFQSWLSDPSDRIDAILSRLTREMPHARLTYIDGFANNDLRLGAHLSDTVHAYAKKSLFRDRRRFLGPTRGDTHLVEYYSDLFGLPQQTVDFKVPADLLGRLHLTPNFFTAPSLLPRFLDRRAPAPQRDRRIDVHARLAIHGAEWYARMRGAFLERLDRVPGLNVATGTAVDWRTYMSELRQSKLCASPFGYGELCWRDMEAFLSGAVLLKPDMGHLDTLPNLYRPYETYVPVAWDFSDLDDAVSWALADEGRRETMARTAFAAVRDYLANDRFVEDMYFVFADQRQALSPDDHIKTSRSVPNS